MNYYKTGQFARLANVSERTIRYYDKIRLSKPSFVMEMGIVNIVISDLLKITENLIFKTFGV